MTDQPDKLDLRSLDTTEDKRQELLRLFPEIRTEGGKLDFERLKLAFGRSGGCGQRTVWHELAGESRVLQDDPAAESRNIAPLSGRKRQL